MANAKQGSSKAGERSHLLGLSPPPPDRVVPPPSSSAGGSAAAAASLSPPKASLTQLATERLGSLKWLMSRDVTISPPSRGPPRLGAGGGGGTAAAGGGGAAAAAAAATAAGLSVISQQGGRVRRSASADIDGVAVASEPRPTRGLFSSASGLTYDNSSRARPPGVAAGNTRRAFGKNAYRLSIDLERAPIGSSVWVKSRRSSVRTPRSGGSTPDGRALGLKEGDSNGQSRGFGRCDSSGQEEGNIEIVDSEDETGAAGGIGDCNLNWGSLWPCGIVAALGLWVAAVAALVGASPGLVAGCAVAGMLLSAVLCVGLATTRVFVGLDQGEAMEGFRDDGYAEEEGSGGVREEEGLGVVVGEAGREGGVASITI